MWRVKTAPVMEEANVTRGIIVQKVGEQNSDVQLNANVPEQAQQGVENPTLVKNRFDILNSATIEDLFYKVNSEVIQGLEAPKSNG